MSKTVWRSSPSTGQKPRIRWTLQALAALFEAFGTCEDRKDVGAIVITGTGDSFCAGVNLKGYRPRQHAKNFGPVSARSRCGGTRCFTGSIRIPKPVLAAVNGIAVGGGLGITLASDIAVCNENASFFASWMSNGIANDGGSSYSLTKIVGFPPRDGADADQPDALTAAEAVEWQICNRMYKNEEFGANVAKIAKQLADGPTHLQAYVKETFHEGWRRSLEECTEYECMNILKSLDNPYATERSNHSRAASATIR